MYAFNKMLCSVEKTQNPVLLQIYSYKAGVTLLTKTEPLAKKNGQVKFKHEHDLTSHTVGKTWDAETAILHFQ